MLKQIEEFPDYSITEDGRVFKNDTGQERKRQTNIDGYWVVNLTKDGKNYHRRCARMVGLTYLQETYKKGFVINHKDFDRKNDHASNLEWVSIGDNNRHSVDGQPHLHTRGSEYSEEFIRNVCSMIQNGVRNVDIRKQTGISKDALLTIRCGASWVWVSKDYNMTPSRRGVSENTVKWACYKIKEGLPYKQILEQSACKNLTVNILKHIKSGKSWSHVSKHILD